MTSHPRVPSDEHTEDCECKDCQPESIEDVRRGLAALTKIASAGPDEIGDQVTNYEVPLIEGLSEILDALEKFERMGAVYLPGENVLFITALNAAYTVACITWICSLGLVVEISKKGVLVYDDNGNLGTELIKGETHVAIVQATWAVAQQVMAH